MLTFEPKPNEEPEAQELTCKQSMAHTEGRALGEDWDCVSGLDPQR